MVYTRIYGKCSLLPRLAACIVVCAFLGPSQAAAGASESALAFVQKAAVDAISILSNRSLPDQQRRAQFRSAVLRYFDAPTIGRGVVEPYWSRANAEQQGRFQAVFAGALANIYTERFYDYDGQSLQVRGSRAGAEGATIVRSTVSTPTGSKVYDVDWVVLGPAGREKFSDVIIDGISTSATTKQDYASFLRGANGNLDALTAALKAKGN